MARAKIAGLIDSGAPRILLQIVLHMVLSRTLDIREELDAVETFCGAASISRGPPETRVVFACIFLVLGVCGPEVLDD